MKKIVVAFDIDQTLFNSENHDDQEWIGSKEAWLNLLARLKIDAQNHEIELHFAIVTTKDGVDDLVLTVAETFKDYLFAYDTKNHLQLPIIDDSWVHAYHDGVPIMAYLNSDKEKKNKESSIISSIHITNVEKSLSLKTIAGIHQIKDFSKVFLVDDCKEVLDGVKLAGFSTISAEGVCAPDKETRDKNGVELIGRIENQVAEKIRSMYKPFKSEIFAEVPPLTPLQQNLLVGFIGFEEMANCKII